MSSREEILNRLRGKSSVQSDEVRRKTVDARIRKHPRGVLPAAPEKKTVVLKQFAQKAKEADATVVRCSAARVPNEIAAFLRKHNLPHAVKTGDDKRLAKLLKESSRMLELSRGRTDGDDLVAVTMAIGGIAETGTLILASGKDNPTTLNFLPENHIVVLDEKSVAAHQEDLWKVLRKKYGSGKLPRAVNMTTGPSRSADIEQTLILGAHGPIRLHIIMVRE